MRTKQVFLFMVMSALIVGHPAFAQEPPGPDRGPGPGGEKVMADTEKKAGLTPEQREKIKALREEFRKTQGELHAQLKAKREALRQELDAEKPSREKAEAVSDEMIKIQAQIEKSRLDHIFAIRAIMTPEQFSKIRAMMEEKRKNREKGKSFNKDRKGHRGDGFRGEEEEGPRE